MHGKKRGKASKRATYHVIFDPRHLPGSQDVPPLCLERVPIRHRLSKEVPLVLLVRAIGPPESSLEPVSPGFGMIKGISRQVSQCLFLGSFYAVGIVGGVVDAPQVDGVSGAAQPSHSLHKRHTRILLAHQRGAVSDVSLGYSRQSRENIADRPLQRSVRTNLEEVVHI